MQTLTCEKVLLELSKLDYSSWPDSIQRICRDDAKALKIERVSAWLYTSTREGIACECLYRLSTETFEKGLVLKAGDYPRYFQALEENRTVSAHDARQDPRTSEFAEGYLKPLQITSMMDVPIRLDGKVIGVLCHEHVGPQRRWSTSDEEFATLIATYASLAYANSERQAALEEVRQLREQLGRLNRPPRKARADRMTIK